MKSELYTTLVQHILSKNKDNKGFTLIELLIVFILIGILSAIALPSFLNQSAKARQSEAKMYIGAVNRAQQAYRMENTLFTNSLDTLQIGIPASTNNYIYILTIDANTAIITATPNDTNALKGFNGGVTVLLAGQTLAVACQTAGTEANNPVTPPSLTSTSAACTGTMRNMD
ncbi:MAG: prepilin-type N-terminal cleavage/methylation domain-containing protein [Dolichospermum sp. DET50]|nr:prepilin-type N-terminal cleavage/methylation domain-containing protein [Dolichospermum sp. DET66]MBS3032890.1 prepilin-type N-terminal cleavage/methylation domain-containing protein [Dolichospermum sp. DET67]MBS3038095.1 prepilin-type N-terminal cleavage/methylation domain-containing protein [Dolichospermum sp. DET50]QSX70001.1 MAG: prepilin-type N-terminal cleavage/methylation domain-containing protein [Dolichospermum sp. DET69]